MKQKIEHLPDWNELYDLILNKKKRTPEKNSGVVNAKG
jgi:hypothetical protein